jgi:hypothetical protein
MMNSQHRRPDPSDVIGVFRGASIFWLGLLLTALFQRVVIAQTRTVAVEPRRASTVTPATPQPIRRRPPKLHTPHGSISGSQANPLADHPVARLFDHFSEQNPLGLEFYGYLDQGVTLNPASPSDRLNGPVETNYRSNDYQMNALYLVGERKVDPKRGTVQLGGRADVLYGTDAPLGGTSLGFDAQISSSRFYQLAIPQIYANLLLPLGDGISFKIGKFYTPIGNEWLINTENFFYSHFLSWNIQPGTHTGVLMQAKFTDSIQIQFGPNLGWNTSENSNHATSYLTTLEWKSPNERSQIDFAIQTGRQRTVVTVADSNVTVYSLILNQKICQDWHYRLEHDLLVSQSRTGTPRDNFESYSLANYLFYNIDERWRAGLRFEWLRDDDGTLTGFEPTRPSAPGSYYNLTFGLNWYPREYLRIRPEIRRDWQVRDSKAVPAAFDDGTSTNQWLIACDVLWEF